MTNSNEKKYTFDNHTNVKFKPMGDLVKGFTVIPNQIMNDMKNIGPEGFMVFAKILQYINSDKNKVSVLGLVKLTGLSKGKVSKGLNNLINLGYINRVEKRNGNLINGYIYEVYSSPRTFNENDENNHENLRETVGNSRYPENRDTDLRDPENTTYKKENKKKEKENKENKDVDVVGGKSKANEVIELFKTYKLQKRVMPQTIKLLNKYADIFDIEVFEELFMIASEDKIESKYRYLKTTFENLEKEGVKTLLDLEQSAKKFKDSKTITKKAKSNKKAPVVKTRFHNINESFRNYSEDELVEVIKESQKGKFGEDNPMHSSYTRAIKNGLNSLSIPMRKVIIEYAKENNLEIPN